jgi:hypothetical protein
MKKKFPSSTIVFIVKQRSKPCTIFTRTARIMISRPISFRLSGCFIRIERCRNNLHQTMHSRILVIGFQSMNIVSSTQGQLDNDKQWRILRKGSIGLDKEKTTKRNPCHNRKLSCLFFFSRMHRIEKEENVDLIIVWPTD